MALGPRGPRCCSASGGRSIDGCQSRYFANGQDAFRGLAILPWQGANVLISREDCIALCGLTEAEVLAIAEHEHIPEIAAAALASYLLRSSLGATKIRDMISDDIRDAIRRNDRQHARELLMALRNFIDTHPELKRS